MIKRILRLLEPRRKSRNKIKCCDHVNPPQARFCGGCGRSLHAATRPPDLTAHVKRRSGASSARLNSIAGNGWAVALPLVTFALSVILTVASLMLASPQVSAADGFSDIPLDHPAYELTTNLLRINAITTRSNLSFMPYEQILPHEWNYCIDAIEKFLGFGLPADCRFREFDRIDSNTLQDKGRILARFLGWDEPDFQTGTTRVEAYNMIEQICFGGRIP